MAKGVAERTICTVAYFLLFVGSRALFGFEEAVLMAVATAVTVVHFHDG